MKNPEYDDTGAGEPPGGAAERGMLAAKAGLKIGGNYARYLSRRATGTNKEDARNKLHTANAQDLFSDLAKLRGTALKMAQGMSMEPGILPEQFSQILAKAQYEVPAMGPVLVRRLITQGLGMAPEKAFAEFSATAMAAASLGQVHRARLHDGRDVVVKVQYPNVRESIDSDLRILRGIAARFIDGNAVDPYLNEVRDRMMEETDYVLEGKNIAFFSDRYKDTEIVIPQWVPEKTTERVLTMTYVDGVHLKEYLATDPSQSDRNRYGQLLWDSIHAQIAADHLTVHADAHPGNFLFREDGKLGILDFGCVKHFPRQFRDDLLTLFRARMAGDRTAEEEAYLALEILPPEMNEDERKYLFEILDLLGGVINKLYEADHYDFGSGALLASFQAVMPKLSGREAFKHRRPVGSHHFVFVNRLLAGMLSILTQLESTIDTRFAVECLGTIPTSPTKK